MIEGYKTYIVAALMIALAIAKGQGWISSETFMEIMGILGGLGLSTLRSGAKSDAAKATHALIDKDCGCVK